MILLVTGVSGSGKTTVGQRLADRLGIPFFDADDFHPRANVAKMILGRPLTDADRIPWLNTLRGMIEGWMSVNASAVLACSALKKRYRELLVHPGDPVRIVYLRGDFDTIRARMQARPNHFFKPEMLQSQFDALEPPTPAEALSVDITDDVETVVQHILNGLAA